MKRKQTVIYAAAALAMATLILNSRQTLAAASQGLELCIRTAIPSLFPFFVLSGILVPGISTIKIPTLGRILHLPAGWESVFLLSCVGGYPIGAQCITQGYKAGHITGPQASRMLGFCNNCGPSFLFGVAALFFPHPGYAACIWFSCIASAVVTGHLWPCVESNSTITPQLMPVSLPQAVKQAIRSMANVCAWIILGKILVDFIDQMILCRLQAEWTVILGGILELTNGCLSLGMIGPISIRLLAASFLCSFGGLCVAMQVNAICSEAGLNTRNYLPQKLVQGILSVLITAAFLSITIRIVCFFLIGIWILFKTTVAFPGNIMYNDDRKGGFRHAVPQKD